MIFDFYQQLKDFYHATHPGRLDWITQNRLKIKSQRSQAAKTAVENGRQPGRKKLLFWSTTSWERGGMEHMLAYAMALRGHAVHGVTCSGGFSTCSMDTVKSPRPDCDYCHKRNAKLLDVFGLNPLCTATSDLISQEKIKSLEDEVMSLSPEAFAKYSYRGIDIGRLVSRDLPQYFFRITDLADPQIRAQVFKALHATAVYAECAYEMVGQFSPDIGMVTSGKTVSFSPFYEVCRKLGIPVITWDESGYEKDGYVFKVNQFANEYHLEDAWEMARDQPLTMEQKYLTRCCLDKTRKGDVGLTVLYKNFIENHDSIRTLLGLDPQKKLVVLLANITWDTSSLGRDVAFPGMFEWICATIDFFRSRPDRQLVIRCHPSEGHVPVFIRSDEKISDKIMAKYGALPAHIKVVAGESNLKSHELCEMSDLILVYTTFVGLEMAVQGRRVVVCGAAHYRNKGFTVDVAHAKEYAEILGHDGTCGDKQLDEPSIELAWRYAHMFINRVQVYLPEFDMEHRHIYNIDDPSDFLPGRSTRWDRLCENVEKLGLFLDCTPLSLARVEGRLAQVQKMHAVEETS